ncbi:MAG: Mth938-like domain-containing protein [Gammaproteobacteria bacterium]|nr:Mth938-like domain-containing protein [Gammaproteobacteria bacterium]
MKIQLENTGSHNVIRSYAPGCVTVNQDSYAGSVIVTPDRIIADWPPQTLADLTAEHIEAIAALNPEVILLGTGNRLRFPASEVTRALASAQVGFEVMDTGAACRTYNVLMGEGRRVVAALLPITKT